MSAPQVVNTATLMCSFGVAPSNLVVMPINMVMSGNQPAANIMDHKPFMNVMPFGMCTSLSNPVVASATAAAFGVLTPMPCVPATVSPWVPGSPSVMVGNQPAVTQSCTLNCMWGGVIQVVLAGQFTHIDA